MKPKTNRFDLTHDLKFTARMGELVPVLNMECVPGDVFNLSCDSLVRFAPMTYPIMHRVDIMVHYFFVPNRLVWENWEDFIAGVATGGLPYITVDNTVPTASQRFMDYFGIPPIAGTSANAVNVNAIPFAAYNKIYNDYYRDQNLVPNELTSDLADGSNPVSIAQMQLRAYEHDYFTSALPWAQKGAAVDIPLGEIQLKPTWVADGNVPNWDGNGTVNVGTLSQQIDPPYGTNTRIGGTPLNAYNPDGSLVTEATTINDLRRAFRLQEWLEKNARGGTRYTELILNHFGVRSSDRRLQRPEYITGTKAPVIISEVLNTTGESGGLPQGNMAGHGVSVGNGYNGTYRCEEHGYIIGIMSVLPKTAYQQGIPKNFLKNDPLEFFWPSFAHIGEQPIVNNELYAYEANGEDTFGYTPRYAEYKYMASRVAGDFRNTGLDAWHLGRIFTAQPTLSQSFIECNPDDNTRIFAVEDGDDELWCHMLHKIDAIRPMPVFGNPTM